MLKYRTSWLIRNWKQSPTYFATFNYKFCIHQKFIEIVFFSFRFYLLKTCHLWLKKFSYDSEITHHNSRNSRLRLQLDVFTTIKNDLRPALFRASLKYKFQQHSNSRFSKFFSILVLFQTSQLYGLLYFFDGLQFFLNLHTPSTLYFWLEL